MSHRYAICDDKNKYFNWTYSISSGIMKLRKSKYLIKMLDIDSYKYTLIPLYLNNFIINVYKYNIQPFSGFYSII